MSYYTNLYANKDSGNEVMSQAMAQMAKKDNVAVASTKAMINKLFDFVNER